MSILWYITINSFCLAYKRKISQSRHNLKTDNSGSRPWLHC